MIYISATVFLVSDEISQSPVVLYSSFYFSFMDMKRKDDKSSNGSYLYCKLMHRGNYTLLNTICIQCTQIMGHLSNLIPCRLNTILSFWFSLYDFHQSNCAWKTQKASLNSASQDVLQNVPYKMYYKMYHNKTWWQSVKTSSCTLIINSLSHSVPRLYSIAKVLLG